jgi:hypothetical protein
VLVVQRAELLEVLVRLVQLDRKDHQLVVQQLMLHGLQQEQEMVL